MIQPSEVSQPSTPARKWSRFLDAFKPAGKRRRGPSPRFLHAILSTNHAGKVSVAIQNEDRDEDVVIVTTLDEIPFCCHADLLTMNHEQLLAVVKALNVKLPTALQINSQGTDAHIRNDIELIVGLRQNVPDAPIKAAYERSGDFDLPVRNRYSPMSPMSPLARRSRSQGSYTALLASPILDVLQEEAEEVEIKIFHGREEDEDIQPQVKRRKLDEIKAHSTTLFTRKQRVTRSQSARTPTTAPSAAPCSRILRSHSQKLSTSRDSPFMHSSRSAFKTSTPRRIRVKKSASSTTIDDSSVSLPASSSSAPALQRILRSKNGRASDNDMEMTFGIEGMTMVAHASGIDFSMD
jgi:hypothetical protein